MTVTDEEMEKFAHAIAKALQQSRSVSDSEHFDHHIWITERIKHDKMMSLFWERLAEHLASWGAIGLISVIFYALWLYLKHMLVNGSP